MFSYISALLVASFLFYNAIGTTITNTKCKKWARKKNIKIAFCIRKISRKSFNDINEALYNKLSKVPLYLIITGMVLTIISKGNIVALVILFLGAILFPLLLTGLTSFKRFSNSIKAITKQILLYTLFITIIFVFLWCTGDKKLFNDLIEKLRPPKEFSLLLILIFIIVIVAINLVGWLILRLLTKAVMYITIRFARLCYTLNSANPLKPFSLMFQIGSVLMTEVVVKMVKYFWC